MKRLLTEHFAVIVPPPLLEFAAVYRSILVHHSVILELNLPSYRLEKSKEQLATQTSEAKQEP